jgi:hypothetical protein
MKAKCLLTFLKTLVPLVPARIHSNPADILSVYRVIQEEKSILWEETVLVIVNKKFI